MNCTNKNIVLIGMPGSGKSTVGVVLAKVTGKRFFDTDLLIQEYTGETLVETIRRSGIQNFLELENNVICKTQFDNAVIATGGSAVFATQAIQKLKENSVFIYLKISYSSMCERLGEWGNRGIVIDNGQSLEGMYNQREAKYTESADYILECDNQSVSQLIHRIMSRVQGTLI